jgi:hypothetical protein
LLALVTCAPVLLWGFPRGQDTKWHVLWSTQFTRQLLEGELYPRWLAEVVGGVGGPVFFRYPPLAYYAASLFHPFWPEPEQASARLAAATLLAVWLAALGMALWLRRYVSDAAALFGAVLYTLLPYHLLVDLYKRAAYAEVWAFAWVPLLLWAVDRSERDPRRGVVAMALASAALFLTHAPSALTAIPLAVAWGGWSGLRAGAWRAPLCAVAGVGLGAGLAGVYLATALTHGRFVDEAVLTSGSFHYARWFLDRIDSMPMVVWGAVGMAALSVGVGLALGRPGARGSLQVSLARFVALAALVYLGLCLSFSEPLWVQLPLLYRVQFPWRLSLELVALAAAAGALVLDVLARGASGRRAAVVLVALGVGGALLYANTLGAPYRPFDARKVGNALERKPARPEYLVPREHDYRSLFPGDVRIAFAPGRGEAEVVHWRAGDIEIQVTLEAPGRVVLREQSYPGWQAHHLDSGLLLPVGSLSAEFGVLALDLTPGTHHVRITLGPTPFERAGWVVSGISLAILAGLALSARRPAGAHST